MKIFSCTFITVSAVFTHVTSVRSQTFNHWQGMSYSAMSRRSALRSWCHATFVTKSSTVLNSKATHVLKICSTADFKRTNKLFSNTSQRGWQCFTARTQCSAPARKRAARMSSESTTDNQRTLSGQWSSQKTTWRLLDASHALKWPRTKMSPITARSAALTTAQCANHSCV